MKKARHVFISILVICIYISFMLPCSGMEANETLWETAYLKNIGITTSFGRDNFQLSVIYPSVQDEKLTVPAPIYWNGIPIYDYGEIVALRFDSQVQTYTFQSYNAETKYFTNPDLMAGLPILKKYTELDDIPYFETPMLKEGQLYNLTVNSCGIIVTEIIDAKNTGPWYLSNIQTDGQTLTVDLNKTVGDERNPPIVLLAVYGENGELLKTKMYSIQSDTTQYRMPLEASLKPKKRKSFPPKGCRYAGTGGSLYLRGYHRLSAADPCFPL